MIEKARNRTLSQKDRVAHKTPPRVRPANPRNPRRRGAASPLPASVRTAAMPGR